MMRRIGVRSIHCKDPEEKVTEKLELSSDLNKSDLDCLKGRFNDMEFMNQLLLGIRNCMTTLLRSHFV